MSKNFYLKALKKLIEIRIVESLIAKEFKKNKIFAFLHLYIGQEACATGVIFALNKQDQVFGNHRSHGHYLAKGGNLKKMIFEVFGDERGCCKGYGGSMHMLDKNVNFLGSGPILGSVAPIVTGFAAAKKINKQKGVVVGFIGDGAAEEGGFYETINLASVLKVPLMIVIEDNKLAVETTQEVRKPKKYSLEKIIKGYGAIYSKVNGQDFIKVYESTKKLKSKILKKKTVGILHVEVNRMAKHSGANLDAKNAYYREKFKTLIEDDCISILKKNIIRKFKMSNVKIDILESKYSKKSKENFYKVFNEIRIRY